MAAIGVLASVPAVYGQGALLPLVADNQWTYDVNDGGSTMTAVVDGSRTVRGNFSKIIKWTITGGTSDEYWNYWSIETDGSLLLHGWSRPENADLGVAYEPPVRWIDGTATVGGTWSTTATGYDLETGDGPDFTVTFDGEFVSEGQLLVGPDQTPYDALEMRLVDDVVQLGTQTYSIAGRSIAGRERLARPKRGTNRQWYTINVGMIRELATGFDAQLTSDPSGIVPVTPSSWSAVKALYAPGP